jgi:hypothetical protein
MGEAARSRALADHWIQILRERVRLNPDNYRVLSALVGMEGLATDRASMRQDLGVLAEHTKRDPRFSTGGLAFALVGVFAAGDAADLQRVSAAAESRSLNNMHHILRDWYAVFGFSAGGLREELREPFRRLQARTRAELDALGRRYLPAIALQGSSL